MNTGERLKYLRVSKGLTQDEVAIAIGTIKQTIYKYEHGIVSNIPLERIFALASVLGTTPAYLLCLTDDPDLDAEGLRIADKLKQGWHTRTIPDIVLKDAVDDAESELLDAVHRICGMNDMTISEDYLDGSLFEKWNPKKIDLVREFIEDSQPVLQKIITAAFPLKDESTEQERGPEK